MAAFDRLDWTRFDVSAIVAGEGIGVIEPRHRESCHIWLQKHDYDIHKIDFAEGIGPVVVALGQLLRWEEQFGYSLGAESRNLDALWDGFEFETAPGKGVVLELMNAEVAQRDDARWFEGLLLIAHEYSRNQLAIGRRFFVMLVLSRDSALIGVPYGQRAVRLCHATSGRNGDPFLMP